MTRLSKYKIILRLAVIISPLLSRGVGVGDEEVFAQETLTLQQAIELALENNFPIRIAKNQSDINSNDVSLGNAGIGPQVSLYTSKNVANNTTKQRYAIGLDVDKSGVESTAVHSGIALNWTLFDGFKMFATYDKLKEMKTMGELNLKIEIENNIAKVINAYYDVVRQKQLIHATLESISVYEEREQIAQTKFSIGSGSKLEVMQARVDINALKSQLFKLQTALFDVKADLNQLLARAPETDFDAGDTIAITYHPKLEELKTTVKKQNNSLLFSRTSVKISDYSLKEISARRYPKFAVNLNHVSSRSENQAGFVLFNQNVGFNGGFTATWNIFNGFEENRQLKDAQIQMTISKLQYDMTKMQVQTNLAVAYRNFEQVKELLKLEEENSKIAKESVDVALESFRIGKTSSLELKDIQKSYDDALVRLVNALYDAKAAETELMRLNGMLVK